MSEEKKWNGAGEHTDVSEDALGETLQPDMDSLEDGLFLSPDDSEGEVIDVGQNDEQDGAGYEDGQQVLLAENADLKKQLEELTVECDEQKNRVLRIAADLENFRRRSQREKDDLRKYGIDRVVTELLPSVDNLDRALSHAELDSGDTSIVEGVRMVYRQLLSALEKHGVQSFESKGTQFDPQRHEALQQVETTELPNNTVVDEYQKGYFLHDRLLRPALVSVAKNVQNVHASATGSDLYEVEPSASSPEQDTGLEPENDSKGDDDTES